MGDLIPTRLGLDDTARSKLRHSVTNISKWLPAFAVYVSVIAKTQPHHVPDLMGYQILILDSTLWNMVLLVKQELADAVTASVCFM